jgi:hypothetical protein
VWVRDLPTSRERCVYPLRAAYCRGDLESVGDVVPVKTRTKTVSTPGSVPLIGWRDLPFEGDDRCEACVGWGTLDTVLQNAATVCRTCPDCKGRGRL